MVGGMPAWLSGCHLCLLLPPVLALISDSFLHAGFPLAFDSQLLCLLTLEEEAKLAWNQTITTVI